MQIKKIEWNDDLVGFVVTLEDERVVHLQFDKETNRLHADFGTYSAEIYRESSAEMTDEEEGEFWKLTKDVVRAKELELDAQDEE